MRLSEGKIRIKCASCGKEDALSTMDLEEESFCVGEFGMGCRYQHSFFTEIECSWCRRLMSFSIIAYEYPIDCLEYEDTETKGCCLISYPSIEMEYVPDDLVYLYDQILKEMLSLSPSDFEEYVAEVYRQHGYIAKVTGKTRDGGKDIIATCQVGGIQYTSYIQCKKNDPRRAVDVSVVRELYGVLDRDRIDKGIIVTTSYFSPDAIKEAHQYNDRIILIDSEKLCELKMSNN